MKSTYKEFTPGKFRILMLSLHESPTESDDEQKLNVPQAVVQLIVVCVRVKRVQLLHEFIFLKQMNELAASKFDGIDQEYGIVHTRHDGGVRFW